MILLSISPLQVVAFYAAVIMTGLALASWGIVAAIEAIARKRRRV